MLLTHRFSLLFLVAALCIIGAASFVIATPQFRLQGDMLSMAVTFDLTVLIPLLFYVLVVRKRQLSPVVVVPAFLVCLGIAGLLLPRDHHNYLSWMEKVAMLAETALFVYTLSRIRTIVSTFRAAAITGFPERLQHSLQPVIGQNRAAAIVTNEVAMVYYALFAWTKEPEQQPFHQTFTYHKNTGYSGIFGTLVGVVMVETMVIHLLLEEWSTAAAWIATFSSVYTLFFLLADFSAALKRPVLVDADTLCLRTGLRWRVQVPLAEIARVEKADYREEWGKDGLKMVLIGEPDVVIRFKNPVTVEGLYGMQRTISKVGINVDQREVFLQLFKQN